jgi:hypothetical protein
MELEGSIRDLATVFEGEKEVAIGCASIHRLQYQAILARHDLFVI